ncbi:MAG: C45 family peptidase [Pirellulales bacterium]|nr:C45 family peptidase [Pirellulales bacterium]
MQSIVRWIAGVVLFVAVCAASLARGETTVVARHGASLRASVDGRAVLVLRGSHAERGVAHGVLGAREILETVDFLAAKLNTIGALVDPDRTAADKPRINWQNFCKAAEHFEMPDRFREELAGMLHGIEQALPAEADRTLKATGQAITLADLSALQTCDVLELMRCSQFSVWGDLTDDGQVLVGRNWDYPPVFSSTTYCVFAVEPTEPELSPTLDAMWFGMLGTGMAALNRHGIYLAANDGGVHRSMLAVEHPTPAAVVGRMLIEAMTPDDAPEFLRTFLKDRVTLALIFHLVVPASSPGQATRAYALEFAPWADAARSLLREPDLARSNCLVCTNHFVANSPQATGNTAERYGLLADGIRAHRKRDEKIDFEAARKLLDAVGRRSPLNTTQYSAVAWPAERKLRIAVSPKTGKSATAEPYVLFEWDELFGLK